MSLTVVRSLSSARRAARSPQELEEFEQELVDQYALAAAAAGDSDTYVSTERSAIFEFRRFIVGPLWTAGPEDADRYLRFLRRERRLARATVLGKANTLGRFYGFLLTRYQGEIHAVTGHVVTQLIDDYFRPATAAARVLPVPPSEAETERLFTAWRGSLADARKYLPAARDYLAASLWRRVGLRINETVMLDLRDWRPDLGERGKLHVRHGKGSRGRGPKPRLVPAINSVDALLGWWLADVRHQFGDDWSDPDAPLLPSERRDAADGRCLRAGADALRSGLGQAVRVWLPTWQGRLTPHRLRHFCASSLYACGMDIKALQELLGHEWLSTTTQYIHVHGDHVERAWATANARVTARLTQDPR